MGVQNFPFTLSSVTPLTLFDKLKSHGTNCSKPALSSYSVISVSSVVNPPLAEQLLEGLSDGQGSAPSISFVIP